MRYFDVIVVEKVNNLHVSFHDCHEISTEMNSDEINNVIEALLSFGETMMSLYKENEK